MSLREGEGRRKGWEVHDIVDAAGVEGVLVAGEKGANLVNVGGHFGGRQWTSR